MKRDKSPITEGRDLEPTEQWERKGCTSQKYIEQGKKKILPLRNPPVKVHMVGSYSASNPVREKEHLSVRQCDISG